MRQTPEAETWGLLRLLLLRGQVLSALLNRKSILHRSVAFRIERLFKYGVSGVSRTGSQGRDMLIDVLDHLRCA